MIKINALRLEVAATRTDCVKNVTHAVVVVPSNLQIEEV